MTHQIHVYLPVIEGPCEHTAMNLVIWSKNLDLVMISKVFAANWVWHDERENPTIICPLPQVASTEVKVPRFEATRPTPSMEHRSNVSAHT